MIKHYWNYIKYFIPFLLTYKKERLINLIIWLMHPTLRQCLTVRENVDPTFSMMSPSCRFPSLLASPVLVISLMKSWLPRRRPYSGKDGEKESSCVVSSQKLCFKIGGIKQCGNLVFLFTYSWSLSYWFTVNEKNRIYLALTCSLTPGKLLAFVC